MREILTDKFQITVPAKDEAGEPWAGVESTRRNYPIEDPTELPPLGIKSPVVDADQMPLVTSGETDVTKDSTPAAFARGFTKHDLGMVDDQYTGEHVDHFYGDAGGFIERNNYLDRA
jgi:hypothetical protein